MFQKMSQNFSKIFRKYFLVTICENTNTLDRGPHFSRFSSNSEAYASELLENREKHVSSVLPA